MYARGRAALFAAFVLLVSSLPLAPALGASTKADAVPEHVANRALIGAKAGGKSQARRAIDNSGGEVVEYNSDGNFFIVTTPTAAPEWVAKMQRNASLRYAELDYIVRADTHEDSATPNDPKFTDGTLYGIAKIGSERAWHATTGSPAVVVGVIDSGVDYTHDDLTANMWQDPITGQYGRDCRNDDNDPMDDNAHGTHVAGTIGGVGNNGIGVVGVNWSVKIMALKFLSGSGSGSTSDAVECLYWARDNGAHLTSNSWGGGGYSVALYDAIKASADANMPFVAAAGNDGTNNDVTAPHYPSNYDLPNVVSVAATDSTDTLASWSNYGAMTVDLAAPGVSIYSTVPGDKYDTYSGTSMATPHVAGAAALLLSKLGTDTPYRTTLDRIHGSVERIAGLEGKVATGGRLDVERAVESDVDAPGSAPLTLTQATAGSITPTWSAPPEDALAATGTGSSYVLRYKASDATSWSVVPTGAPAVPGTLESVTVGGLQPDTSYDFSLVTKDNVGNTSVASTATATTSAGSLQFFDDRDASSVGGWQANDPWTAIAEHAHSPAQAWSDSPGKDAGGQTTAATGFPYANSKDVSLYSPVIDLSTATEPKLTLWHRYQLEAGYDYGYVYCNKDGGSWNQLAKLNGAKDFHAQQFGLAACEGSSKVQLRFRLYSDRSVTFDGWYIDNVIVRGTATDSVAPAAPTSLVVADPSTGGKLDLDWADNAESDLAGYNVYRSTDQTTWTKVTGSPVSASSYTDTGLTNGTTYHYYATAVDTSGNESGASSTASGTPSDTTAPSAPTNLAASAGDQQVALDWADNAESDLAGYNVYRSPDEATWTKVNASLVSASAYTDTGLTNGALYHYYVTAVDTTGNESAASNVASATPVAALPASTMHVHDLDGSGDGEARGYWHAKVWVFVHDDNGNAVENATVAYDWSVASSKPPCVTDSTGWCSVRSDSVHKGSVKEITFTVTDVAHSTGLAYSGSNHDPEGDSDGTKISVKKPN